MTTTLTVSDGRNRKEELLVKAYTSDDEEIMNRRIEVIVKVDRWNAFYNKLCDLSETYGIIIRRVK